MGGCFGTGGNLINIPGDAELSELSSNLRTKPNIITPVQSCKNYSAPMLTY